MPMNVLPSSSFRGVATNVKAGLLAALVLTGFAPGQAFAQKARPGGTSAPIAPAYTGGQRLHPIAQSNTPAPTLAAQVNPVQPAPANVVNVPAPAPAPHPANTNPPSTNVANAASGQVRQVRPDAAPHSAEMVSHPSHGPENRFSNPPPVVLTTPAHVTGSQVVYANQPGVSRPVVLNSPSGVTHPQQIIVNHGPTPPSYNRTYFSDHFGPPRDIHVVNNIRSGPRYFYGPYQEEFHFVRSYPGPHFIQTRESLRDLLLRPLANSIAWGIGDIVTLELAHALGLPVNTTLYALAPGVAVVSALPVGYCIAEPIPANVALITVGPAGEVIVCNRVTTGSYVAYQTSPSGVVINQVVVVPSPATTDSTTVAAAPETPAPATPSVTSSSVPVSPKVGKVVYDADKNPIGVIVLSNDGSQEFVPLLAQNDTK